MVVLTTIAICSLVAATYRHVKKRRAMVPVTLTSYRYIGNFPDMKTLYNEGDAIKFPQKEKRKSSKPKPIKNLKNALKPKSKSRKNYIFLQNDETIS
uniref:Secreted protein n=1 Tax=Panagrellus redivivus TaxID=6233 RepID=A0A7E4VAW4_PANRE